MENRFLKAIKGDSTMLEQAKVWITSYPEIVNLIPVLEEISRFLSTHANITYVSKKDKAYYLSLSWDIPIYERKSVFPWYSLELELIHRGKYWSIKHVEATIVNDSGYFTENKYTPHELLSFYWGTRYGDRKLNFEKDT